MKDIFKAKHFADEMTEIYMERYLDARNQYKSEQEIMGAWQNYVKMRDKASALDNAITIMNTVYEDWAEFY